MLIKIARNKPNKLTINSLCGSGSGRGSDVWKPEVDLAPLKNDDEVRGKGWIGSPSIGSP